jgi:hypothetical protein
MGRRFTAREKEGKMKNHKYTFGLVIYILLIVVGLIFEESMVYGIHESWGEILGTCISIFTIAGTLFPFLLAFDGDGFEEEANRILAVRVFVASLLAWAIPVALWVTF